MKQQAMVKDPVTGRWTVEYVDRGRGRALAGHGGRPKSAGRSSQGAASARKAKVVA